MSHLYAYVLLVCVDEIFSCLTQRLLDEASIVYTYDYARTLVRTYVVGRARACVRRYEHTLATPEQFIAGGAQASTDEMSSHTKSSCMAMFVDRLLMRIKENWTLGKRSSASAAGESIPDDISVATQNEVVPTGDELWVSVAQLGQTLMRTPVPQQGPLQFYKDCTLPADVLTAMASMTAAKDVFVGRLVEGWRKIATGHKGKCGYAGGMSKTVEGASDQRLQVLMDNDYASLLDVTSDRSKFVQAGKAAVWNGHNKPRSAQDVKELVGETQSGASQVFSAAMSNHTISLARTTDLPDVGHFVEQFAAIIDHHIPGGLRKRERGVGSHKQVHGRRRAGALAGWPSFCRTWRACQTRR